MLIRLLILSAFVLLVHLVVGMFARDLMPLQVHEVMKRAAKDEGPVAASNIMSRRRQMVQQHTVKRAVSHKTARRHRDDSEELLRAEETAYDAVGALVNESSAANDAQDTPAESKESSSTPVTRKRRPVHRVTEPSLVPSHLPVAAALTMSDSLYNHFRPLDREVPEDQFLPFLQFGKKLVPNSKTTYPATVTSSTNALDSVTNSPRLHEYSSFHPPVEVQYQLPMNKPRPSEEEINEDMDVAIVKSVVEKNKAIRVKPNSLTNLRNVGGLYRKQVETNENLVISSDKNSINDTGAKVNDTKDFDRKRLASAIAGKKEVIVDSNGRRKIVAVSRRPILTNITSTAAITNTTPPTSVETNATKGELDLISASANVPSATSTSTTSTTAQPTTTTLSSTTPPSPTAQPLSSSTITKSTNMTSPVPTTVSSTTAQPTITSTTASTLVNETSAEHLMHDPTQGSSSNVVAARAIPQTHFLRNSTGLMSRRRTSPLYNPARRSYPLRTSSGRQANDTGTEIDMIREETNVSSSLVPDTNNGSVAEIKNQTIVRHPSLIEKFQQRRYSRPNYTDILRANKNITVDDSQRIPVNISNVSVTNTTAPSINLSSTQAAHVHEESLNSSTSSERPPSTSTLLVPTTKILSTAVVTSVSIKGAWTSGVTELPPQEVFPEPPHKIDAPDPKEPKNNTDPTSVYPTAAGSATYSMIKDLLAEMNTSATEDGKIVSPQNATEEENHKTDDSNLRLALPLSHEHFVGVDSPRPVFSNSSVVFTTSYNRNESQHTYRGTPVQQGLDNTSTTLTSIPTISTTTSTTTTTTSAPFVSYVTTPSSTSSSPSVAITQALPNSSAAPELNISLSQDDNPVAGLENAQNISKGRALWANTTTRSSTNIPVVQSSDKEFDLPLVKLYNSSTVWGDSVEPTEETFINDTQYETVKTDLNETALDVDKCGAGLGCSDDEQHTASTRRPPYIKGCEGNNSTREGCGSRPREGSVTVAESTSSIEMAIYVLAGICVIPAAVGALFLVRCVVRHRRKVLDESDTCSEISCHRAGENGEATTPASTKLPRLQPHMGWDQEKPATSPPTSPDSNSRWEFPRSMLRLQTVLGQGNFGQVLKAEADDLNGHPGTTRLVAVKLVKEGATTREKEDLLRELEIMKELGAHPNVVTLLGCCTEQEPYLLIMEYVMYGKLLTFLRDHRTRQNYYNFSEDSDALTSRDLTVFGYCVARGMEYLVSKGIIHRDLAARNVLVDHNKLCKIADFGMSRTVRELGEIYEQRQTKGALPIRWMAPESLLYRVFTHKSDVWSFGILMWEIVTLGSTPYPAMGAREVMKRVREGYRLERPSHCRPELFRVISRCWHSDQAKRPDFSELKRELGTLVEDARQGKYVDLDRFAEYSGGRTATLHSEGEPELIHM